MLQDINGTTLFLVPTPIGNLRDITIRALDILREVDLIACEDTRHTRKLLAAYAIRKRLLSYEKFSEKKKVSYLLEQLSAGRSIAIVSDAGTPLISDPGSILISGARELGIRIVALPGPCAAVTALSASGFEGPFRFIGFFPRQRSAGERELAKMGVSPENTIFYESPHRIRETLGLMDKMLKDRPVCLAREISKVHEEYLTGSSLEIMEKVRDREVLGEITMIVQGSSGFETIDEASIRERARGLLDAGHSRKDVLRLLSEETGMGRNQLYDFLLSMD